MPTSLPCPDGGKCHHTCEDKACFRVRHCAPLSGAFADDRWPADILHQHATLNTPKSQETDDE